MEHYFDRYLTPEGFDLPRLLNDDFMLAVKLLFKNRLYVSASKLLISFIDSLGYLEYGDDGNHFARWLDEYADLKRLGITSEELWEHRNSLLHMTNLDSRRVVAGKVSRLVCYIGVLPPGAPTSDAKSKYFSFTALVDVVAKGMEKWVHSLNSRPEKMKDILGRYDLVVSDSRLLNIDLDH